MGCPLAQETFPYQCSKAATPNVGRGNHPSTDDLTFCANTFGQGGHALILGTGQWNWSPKSRWIFQRDFIAFRTEADRLVFLMWAAQ